MISWDNVYFYKDLDDFNPSNKSSEYVDWIRNEFSLYPVTDTTQIIEDAQQFFKLDFDNWVRKFYTD